MKKRYYRPTIEFLFCLLEVIATTWFCLYCPRSCQTCWAHIIYMVLISHGAFILSHWFFISELVCWATCKPKLMDSSLKASGPPKANTSSSTVEWNVWVNVCVGPEHLNIPEFCSPWIGLWSCDMTRAI